MTRVLTRELKVGCREGIGNLELALFCLFYSSFLVSDITPTFIDVLFHCQISIIPGTAAVFVECRQSCVQFTLRRKFSPRSQI
jgi:hypothetical protein